MSGATRGNWLFLSQQEPKFPKEKVVCRSAEMMFVALLFSSSGPVTAAPASWMSDVPVEPDSYVIPSRRNLLSGQREAGLVSCDITDSRGPMRLQHSKPGETSEMIVLRGDN